MIPELNNIDGTESWDELRERFGKVLGLDSPVPAAVMRRAMADSIFAHRLLTSRNSRGFLDSLMRDPRNRAYDVAEPPTELSNRELIGKAAKALVSWGKSGFSQVDQETYTRRIDACHGCPNLGEPGNQLVYKLRRKSEDSRVCKLCGCVAARKARLPTESCPAAHPTEPGLSRWGEPVTR